MLHASITAQPEAVQSWHASPLCQQLIADMFALEDMRFRYCEMARNAGAKFGGDDETAREIGELSSGYNFRRKRQEYSVSGFVKKLFDRLEGERDQWIEDEGYRLAKERGLSLAHDAPDDVQDAVNDIDNDLRRDADSVDRAIDLAVAAFNARVAA